ncbi:unnamed protein product, partial [Staurois parvus]
MVSLPLADTECYWYRAKLIVTSKVLKITKDDDNIIQSKKRRILLSISIGIKTIVHSHHIHTKIVQDP